MSEGERTRGYSDHMPSDGGEQRGAARESNFERYPFFLVSTSRRGFESGYGVLDTGTHLGAGETRKVSQSWYVSGGGTVGPPRGVDQDVYMAVNELLYRYGGMPENDTLHFTLYELLDVLGWETSGRMRGRLRESLERISSATVKSENAFWSRRRGTYVSKTFRLWSVAFGFYRDDGCGLEEKHRLVFDPLFAENWRDDYQPGMDLGFYWELDSHVTKRLYRLLDCVCDRASGGVARSYQVDLMQLRDQIPLAVYGYASQVERILAPAHEELMVREFLADVSTFRPEGKRGPTLVRYEIAPRFDRRRIATDQEQNPHRLQVLQTMLSSTASLKRRLSRDKAIKLIDAYGPERCLYYAEIFPSKRADSAGLLVKAIEEGYAWERPAPEPIRDSSRSSAPPAAGAADVSGAPGESGYGFFSDPGACDQPFAPEDVPTGNGNDVSTPFQRVTDNHVRPEEKRFADDIWQEILHCLCGEGSSLSVGVWFEGTHARSLSDGVLTLVVPNETARDYIGGRFMEDMEQYLSKVLASRGHTGDSEVCLVVAGGGG